jgi:hypothetical protein
MIASRVNLKSKDQTGAAMYKMTKETAPDLLKINVIYKGKKRNLGKMPLITFFDFVRNIKYRVDPKPREILARPFHSVKNRKSGIDCKKKAILIGAWAELKKIPWRFVATSKRPDKRLHHTYTEYNLSGKWCPMDATYKNYLPCMKKQNTKKVILRGAA